MARKEKYITVEGAGRDYGKMFFLKEMDADKAERWGLRAISALIAAGAKIPDGMQDLGIAVLAQEGIKSLARIPTEVSLPLLDELLQCVQIVPEPLNKEVTRGLLKSDIEEPKTYTWLRIQVLNLHIDFFDNARD